MIKSVSIVLSVCLLMFSIALPVQARMLIPTGGWLVNEGLRFRTYTDFSHLYRIAAENILGHAEDGSPITLTITSVDYPFSVNNTALGVLHCLVADEKQEGLIAINNLKTRKVEKAWDFDGQSITEISANNVSCDLEALER
jgi:hypothetical protein